MIHPDTMLGHVSEAIGNGIFAAARIPRGTIVYVIDPLDIKLSMAEFKRLRPPMRNLADKYAYVDRHGRRVLS